MSVAVLVKTNVRLIRSLEDKVAILHWALKEFHGKMLVHYGPVAGPNNFTDVLPWLLASEPLYPPPPQLGHNRQPTGDSEEEGPSRRPRRNSTSTPSSLTYLTM
jgi:hypothetical protein